MPATSATTMTISMRVKPRAWRGMARSDRRGRFMRFMRPVPAPAGSGLDDVLVDALAARGLVGAQAHELERRAVGARLAVLDRLVPRVLEVLDARVRAEPALRVRRRV